MQFKIEQRIFESYPELLIGVVAVKSINNAGEYSEIQSALRSEEARIRGTFATSSPSEHPNIAPWREAYRRFGAKPKDYPSSVENLIRRVAKGYAVPHINTLVDIYNTISLRFVVPAGGEDLDSILGDVVLTFAGADEAAIRLLGEKEERAPHAGEVIYKDDAGAICRRWNWKEADRTKLSETTRNAVLVIEALPPVHRGLLTNALEQLTSSIQQYCGGEAHMEILDSTNPAIIINT